MGTILINAKSRMISPLVMLPRFGIIGDCPLLMLSWKLHGNRATAFTIRAVVAIF